MRTPATAVLIAPGCDGMLRAARMTSSRASIWLSTSDSWPADTVPVRISPDLRVDTNSAVGSTTISVNGFSLTRAMSFSAVRTPVTE